MMYESEECISCCVITYNHEPFIEKALDGILMHECFIALEIIIGEDCSQDNTYAICQQYAKKYPNKITLLPTISNIGMMPNFIRTLNLCSGKYIALCEGDDYWTDPYKLQKQVDYLENNPDVVCCFHNAYKIYDDNQELLKKNLFVKRYDKIKYEAEDILKTWLIPTASMVFRNVLPKELPDFIKEATHGDLALQMYLSEFGSFGLINEPMSVYRINASSATQSGFKGIEHNEKHIHQLILMDEYFRGKYSKHIKKRIVGYKLSSAILLAKIGEKKSAFIKSKEAFRISPFSVLSYPRMLGSLALKLIM